jgi:ABC-2 type transport system ATP-binding protein
MIEFKGVRKEYDDLVAVRDLNLSIAEGEIFGLIGPNGAGKTTLIKMACGLLAPTQGSIEIGGINVHVEPERAQRGIGYLADFFAVYEDLKVWEYLDYFANAYKLPPEVIPQRINETIEQVKLEVKRDALIKGLSRGMKQRLGIARAVIHRPRVLLLDEPASGLDPKSRIDLRNLLLDLQKNGTTILISSHILPDLEGFCTSIGIMERGQMLQSGRVDRLAQERPARVMRIELVSGATVPQNLLDERTGVSNVVLDGNTVEFQMAGAGQEVSALLRDIVAAGLPVVSFHEVKQTVEELYLKISHHEVM